jgi:hypothetical protein
MPTTQQSTIIRSLNLANDYKRVESDVVVACRDMQVIVENQEKTKDEKEDELHLIKSQINNNGVKIASNSVLQTLSNTPTNNNNKAKRTREVEVEKGVVKKAKTTRQDKRKNKNKRRKRRQIVQR